MTNILNAHLMDANNVLPAAKLSKSSKKQSQLVPIGDMYEYSINKSLKEADDFKRNIVRSMREESLYGKKISFNPAFVAALALGVVLFIKSMFSK